MSGFSLHAGVASQAHQRKKLERLCRYVSRSAVSEQRIELTESGKVRYELKTPYRNGTTHVIFEPLDFIARLAALVPKPRVNLTRFHGVFAPNSKHRKLVTSDKKEAKKTAKVEESRVPHTEAEKRRGMTWAQRLKRVFNIDVQTCTECGGFVKVIACVEEPELIKKILAHVNHKSQAEQENQLPELRAPPQIQGNLFN